MARTATIRPYSEAPRILGARNAWAASASVMAAWTAAPPMYLRQAIGPHAPAAGTRCAVDRSVLASTAQSDPSRKFIWISRNAASTVK